MNTWFRQSYYGENDTADDVVHRMDQLRADLALDHFSYGIVKMPAGLFPELDPELHTTYPDEWIERYTVRQYINLDPVCELTRNSTRPFFWGHGRFLRGYRKQQRTVFHEARAFSIMNGLCIPVRGAHGEIGTFNVVSSDQKHLRDVVTGEQERLFQAAFDTHDLIVSDTLSRMELSNPPAELTLREKECLLWTLEGKTADDVADLLGLSVFTVNRHASTAAQKLGCTSKHHAAVQALRAGLI
ncbi:MAG: autoinducer binding domain-containing protein [Pseudomonadota bacterium]